MPQLASPRVSRATLLLIVVWLISTCNCSLCSDAAAAAASSPVSKFSPPESAAASLVSEAATAQQQPQQQPQRSVAAERGAEQHGRASSAAADPNAAPPGGWTPEAIAASAEVVSALASALASADTLGTRSPLFFNLLRDDPSHARVHFRFSLGFARVRYAQQAGRRHAPAVGCKRHASAPLPPRIVS